MSSTFSRPFDVLDESDIRDLIDVRRVREHVQLEYKSNLPSHSDKDTVELLADVTAMANAMGGYILIGVEEDEASADGTPSTVAGIEHGDDEVHWIQSVCLSCIDRRIPNLRVRDIPLANGRTSVVIEIPNSPLKPHMVTYRNHRSFRMRHGREKSDMNMQEVQEMILRMQSYSASLEEFLNGRRRFTAEHSNGRPWMLLMATPLYVEAERLDALAPEIRAVLADTPKSIDAFVSGVTRVASEPTIYGAKVAYGYSSRDEPPNFALRLFRNGHLEYAARLHLSQDGAPPVLKLLPYDITYFLVQFLQVGRSIFELGEVDVPIVVTLHLQNVAHSLLVWWKSREERVMLERSEQIRYWEEKFLSISMTARDLNDLDDAARRIIDRLFNAFGRDENPHFDNDGHFIRRE
ncbi:MAG: ATP-binding protein [Chloroflexi bacterium]|nr:ATP-binding protein [Chloroflexota bacterium]